MTERRDPSKTAISQDDGFSFTATDKGKKDKDKEKRPVGVYITLDQRKIIEHIAQERGTTKYAVMRFAVAYFLKAYQQDPGIMQVKTITKQVLEQP